MVEKFSLGHGILGSHQNFEGHILIEAQQGIFIRDVDDQFESSIDLVSCCVSLSGAETPLADAKTHYPRASLFLLYIKQIQTVN